MTKMKKVIAMMLALLMTFSSMSVLATAWDVDELVDTELSIRTEFLKEVGGEWVVTEKVIPGQAVKARIYVGTNYYSNDSELLFHYDDSFFDVSFTDGEVYDLEGINSAACSSAMIMNHAADKTLGVLVETDSIYNAVYDSDAWLFEIPLTVKSTASGKGRIYVEETDVRNTDNQEGYINVPAGPEGGSAENYNQVISMDHWDIDSVVLDNPYVTINTKLVYHANGGAFASGDPDTFETTGVIGSDLSVPAVAKEGYEFRGWTEEADVLPYADAPEKYPELDGEFYAYWDKKVDFVFDAGEGSFESGKTVKISGLVPEAEFDGEPAAPVREGYTFTSWDKNVPETVPYAVSDEEYTVTFNAVWAKNVTIRFVDGETVYNTFDGYDGKEFSDELKNTVEDPEKPGYYFSGWSPEMPAVFPAESTDYAAQWEDRTYTIRYFIDGEFKGSAQVAYNAEIGLDYPSAKADYGYELGDWHLGSITGDVVTAETKMPGNNISVYNTQSLLKDLPAVFKKDASDEEGYATTYADFDSKISVPEENPEKAGYNFIGWEPQVGFMDNINGKVFVAVWEPAEVNVSFYAYNEAGEYELYECYGVENGQTIDVPADPYMDGYTFTGWATSENQTSGTDAETLSETVMGTEELKYYEARKANTYTVKFDVDGGTAVTTPQTVTFGNDIVLPATTKTGYTLNGWKDEGGVTHTENYKAPALDDGAEIELTAQWTINKYSVIFKDYDGTEIKTVEKNYNAEILNSDIPEQPTRQGYSFTEWTEIPTRMPVSENGTIVTAQYEIESYTYAFNSDGGSAVASIGPKNYGEAIEAPANPTKEGYDFDYWFVNGDVSETEYTIPATMPDLGDDGTTVTLKAKWKVKEYTITFDSIGGSAVAPITKNYGETVSKPADPTKEGYTFAYWYEDGNENTPYVFTKMPAKSFTLYAKWNNDEHTAYKVVVYTMDTTGEYVPDTQNRAGETGTAITFDDVKPTLGDGFEFGDHDTSKTISADGKMEFNIYVVRKFFKFTAVDDEGKTVKEVDKVYFGATLPQPETPSKTGYDFAYWYTDNEKVEFDITTETMPAADLTVTAQFTPETYENAVKFNANTGAFSDESTEKTATATFGQQFSAPAVPAKYGYTFKGWAASADEGAAVVAAPGAKLPALNKDLDDEELTYYAVWEVETYTDGVVFNANGGKFANESKTKTATATFGQAFAAPEEPTRVGYKFIGWTASTEEEAEIVAAPGENLPALDKDLDVDELKYFAAWEAETYENGVIFDANGGKYTDESIEKSVTVTYGEAITPPSVPAKSGYKFAGWTAEKDGSVVLALIEGKLPALNKDLNGSTEEVEPITYYAKWNNSTDTPYTVMVYTMGVDGKYDEGVPGEYAGTTGATVKFDEVKPDLGEGFNFGVHDTEKTISADGKMVFNIYVVRESSKFTAVADDETVKEVDGVLFGAALPQLEAPTKKGHDFAHWYTDNENVEFDITTETMPASNLTVTAKFTPETYENGVKFDANAGKFADETTEKSVTATFGETFEAPASPTRYGYEFKGWATSNVATAGETIGALNKDLDDEALTYYAVWEVETYTDAVVFNANGGKFANESETADVTATFGKAVVPPAAPTKAGYEFIGWAASAGSDASIVAAPGANLPVLNKDLDEETLTYYAKWSTTGNTGYNVVVYKMGVDGNYAEDSRAARTGDCDSAVIYADVIGTVVVGDGFEVNTSKSDETKTITADGKMEFNIYLDRKEFEAIFKDGETTVDTVSALYGAAIEAPEAPEKEGRTFVKWVDADGAEPSTMPLNGAEFNAKYENITYKVNYFVNGEFVGSNSIEYSTEIPTTCATYAAEEGYELDGWYVDEEMKTKLADGATIGAANTSLYGKTSAKEYEIKFDANGGKFGDESTEITKKAFMDGSFEIPADPTRKGYIFAGWDPDTGVGELSTPGDKVYTAIWDVDPAGFKADFMQLNSETNPSLGYKLYESIPLGVGDNIEVPADPFVEGYEFLGWSTEAGKTTGLLSSEDICKLVMGEEDETFYAVFEAIGFTITYNIYKMDVKGEYGTADDTFGMPATIGGVFKSADYEVPEGFALDTAKSTDTITVADGTEVMNIYLARNKYNINYYLDEKDATPAFVQEVYYGDLIILAGQSKGEELIAASTDDEIKYGSVFVDWDCQETYEYMPADEITVIALLNPKEYTVNFYKRLVDEYSAFKDIGPDQVVVYYGDEVVIPGGYEEVIGYTFEDWSTDLPFTVGKDTPEEQAIYAIHNINKYRIRFFVDEEAFDAGTAYKAYDGDDKLPFETDLTDYVPDMTNAKEGHTFDGWDSEPVSVEEFDADYIAQWTVNQYGYSFVISDTKTVSGEADYGSKLSDVLPEAPAAPEGKRFIGWSKTEGGKTPVKDFGTVSATPEDNTFYAIFVDASSSTVFVTFYDYDGSSEHGPATGTVKEVIVTECAKQYGDSSEVEVASELVLPEAPELANYTFGGWFDAEGNEWKAGNSVPDGGLELYAKYVRVQCGLIARSGSTTVIERGDTEHLNNLDDVASYTEGSYWFVYGLKDRLSETKMLSDYVDVVGDCSITVVHSHKTMVGTGSTITVTDNVSGEIVEKFVIIIYGDVDGNGSITANDVMVCDKEQLNLTSWSNDRSEEYDPILYKAANLDGKNRVRANDVSIIEGKSLNTNEIDQVNGCKAK